MKYFCLTINNYQDSDFDVFDSLSTKSIYAIAGREVAKTGTPHLQCFIAFKNETSFQTVRALFPRAHIEKMRTTVERSVDYCKKEDDYVEYGSYLTCILIYRALDK